MEKLGNEWQHITVPIFLFRKNGEHLDSNEPGKNLIVQFESVDAWKGWVRQEILSRYQEEDVYKVFFVSLPFKNSHQQHCVQVYTQKEETETYFRIQIIPLAEKISTKKSKKIDWQQFVDSIHDLVYVIDYQRRFLYANQAFQDFLCKPLSDLIGFPFFSVFPQAKGTLIEEKLLKVMETGEVNRFQYFFPIPPFENWLDIQMIPLHQSVFVWMQIIEEPTTDSVNNETVHEHIMQCWHFLPDPVILFDQSFKNLEANPAFYHTFLLSFHQKIDPHTLWSWFFPETKDVLISAIEKAFIEGKGTVFEWKTPISRLISKTFSVSVFPILDETTTPYLVAVHCHDLSKKVEQIKSAHNKIASFNQIMNSLQFMLLVVTDDWQIEYANQTAKQFFDLPELEDQQCLLLHTVPEMKGTELSEKIRIVLAEQKSFILEGIPLRNRLFYIALFSIPSGVICLFRDVTDKNFLARQTSLAEMYSYYLVEHSPDAIYIQSKDGEILFTNPSYRQKEAKKQLPELIQNDQSVLTGKTVWNDFSPSSDESRFFQLMQFPYLNEKGSIDGICGIIRDVTEAKIKNQMVIERTIPWINLIQSIRSLVNHYLSLRDWIKFFLMQLSAYSQASHLWVCIKTSPHHWLKMDWKSDGSFQQALMNDKETRVFCEERHCADFESDHSFKLSHEGSFSTIMFKIMSGTQVIGWLNLTREERIDKAFIGILTEVTHLISDYQEFYTNRERERKYYSQYATLFHHLPDGLAMFDPSGKFEICNAQFQYFFPSQLDFHDINLWDLEFLNPDQLTLVKMGLMVQINAESFQVAVQKQFGQEILKEEIHQLLVLSIQDDEYKNTPDHYLILIQPSFSTSVEQVRFQENWDQTSKDLQHQLLVIREVLSLLIKTTDNRNELEMAKQMNRNLLRYMRTFRIFVDDSRQKIMP